MAVRMVCLSPIVSNRSLPYWKYPKRDYREADSLFETAFSPQPSSNEKERVSTVRITSSHLQAVDHLTKVRVCSGFLGMNEFGYGPRVWYLEYRFPDDIPRESQDFLPS